MSASYVTGTQVYTDNGIRMLKQTWYDPNTGSTWDTFDPAPSGYQDPEQSRLDKAAQDLQNSQRQARQDYRTPNYTPGPTFYTDQTRGYRTPFQDVYSQPGIANYSALPSGSYFAGGSNYAAPAPNNPQYQAGQTATPTGYTQAQIEAANAQPGAPAANAVVAPAAAQPAQQVIGDQNMSTGSLYPNPQGGIYQPREGLGSQTEAGARNTFLYDPASPSRAFGNVLRGMGMDPGANNPLVNILMRSAPGLGAAFLIENAGRGQIGANEDPGAMFGSYINRALSGNMGSAFANARSALPGLMSQMSQPLGGMGEQNLYASILQDALQSGTGQGLVSALGSLQSPFLNPQFQRAYESSLGDILARNQYQFGQTGDFTNRDWLSALYNGGR